MAHQGKVRRSMKQFITDKQIEELTPDQKQRYTNIFYPTTEQLQKGGFRFTQEDAVNREGLPNINIGQMIEFIEPHRPLIISCVDITDNHSWVVNGIEKKELCDALWQEFKEVI